MYTRRGFLYTGGLGGTIVLTRYAWMKMQRRRRYELHQQAAVAISQGRIPELIELVDPVERTTLGVNEASLKVFSRRFHELFGRPQLIGVSRLEITPGENGTYRALAFWRGDPGKLRTFPQSSRFRSSILIRRTPEGLRIGLTFTILAVMHGITDDLDKARQLYLACIRGSGITGCLRHDGNYSTQERFVAALRKPAKKVYKKSAAYQEKERELLRTRQDGAAK